LGGRGRRISEFEASLVYKVSSRTARLYRETLSQKKKKKKNHFLPQFMSPAPWFLMYYQGKKTEKKKQKTFKYLSKQK
jgi:hypothetical protein